MVYQTKIFAIIFTLFCFGWNISSAWGQSKNLALPDSDCEAIGRILSSNHRNFQPGSSLCAGYNFHSQAFSGLAVQVLCYLNMQVVAAQKCVAPSASGQTLQCSLDKKCFEIPELKGPHFHIKTAFTNPLGHTILEQRPVLSWLSEQDATSYTVHLNGNGIDYWQDVSQTSLKLPQLEFGGVYRVDLITNLANSPALAQSTVLIVLSQSKALSLSSLIKRIRSFNLSQDDLAFDQATAYLSYDLLSEAIAVLRSRAKTGTSNTRIYQLLSNCYLQAGFPEDALHALQQAHSAHRNAQR